MSRALAVAEVEVVERAEDGDLAMLRRILSFRRPHNSVGEAEFVDKIIVPLGICYAIDATNTILAYTLTVADKKTPDIPVPVLWSCHIDTMHNTHNVNPKQKFVHDHGTAMIYKQDKDCLGADDGAGIWLLLEMIKAGVPGTYIFHRGEEKGGIGSRGMVANYPDWLRGFKWAIAFDRKGTGDVITEMFSGVTASDEFAKGFAQALNGRNAGFEYAPDNSGSFTDTANYRHHIAECTNISVGYECEHTHMETLDVEHLVKLRSALIEAFKDGVDLPVVRDPNAPDVTTRHRYTYVSSMFEGYERYGEYTPSNYSSHLQDYKAVSKLTYEEIHDYCEEAPSGDVADLVCTLRDEIDALIATKYGR